MSNVYRDIFHQIKQQLSTDTLWLNIEQLAEQSKWHREDSVAVHTEMVLAEFDKLYPEWDINKLKAMITLLFHDVGKPAARTFKLDEDGVTKRYRFTGHELKSARLFEQWALANSSAFNGVLTASDFYGIMWCIENHLQHGVKNKNKIQRIIDTATHIFGDHSVFTKIVQADALGRIPDDPTFVRNQLGEFVNMMDSAPPKTYTTYGKKVATVLIGATCSGKTTYATLSDVELVLNEDIFKSHAANAAELDEIMSNNIGAACTTGSNFILDADMLSKKKRRRFLSIMRAQDYSVRAVLFPVHLSELLKRAGFRNDKEVAYNTIQKQIKSFQQPSYGEFDEIIINLDGKDF